MQANFTLKKIGNFFNLIPLLIIIFSLISGNINAQTISTTGFTNNNQNAVVTFNFKNNNATGVIITGISSICAITGSTNVSAYFKTTAINGLPGAISAGNGWTQFGSATIAGIGNTTTTTTQPFMTGLSLLVPPGATYGIAVQAIDNPVVNNFNLRYSTIAPGTYTFSAGGCDIIAGTNISYGGTAVPAAPTFTPRGFLGTVTFIPAIPPPPCAGTPIPGNTLSTANPACPNINFTLSTQVTPASGLTYQWQSGPSAAGPWTNMGTAPSQTTSQTVATFYRAIVTCGANSATSTPLQVIMNN
ncbi:MAG: hypothetical protein SGI83_14805, partial [Bacteroidota bacterium]|nr:hypothetical protein [Bacteroidota bacterium]